jgi:hypothetical protein
VVGFARIPFTEVISGEIHCSRSELIRSENQVLPPSEDLAQCPFQIAPGEKYISRYRYLVRSKTADSKLIDEHWRRYTKDQN